MNPGSDQKIKTGETLKIPQKNSGTEQKCSYHSVGETLYKLTQTLWSNRTTHLPGKSRTERGKFPYRTGYRNSRKNEDSEEIIINEVKAAQTTKPVTTSTPLKPKCRDMHKVERKETIFSISRVWHHRSRTDCSQS